MIKNRKKRRTRDFTLEGTICMGRKWDEKLAEDFHMKFPACSFFHAKRVALGRLKGFAIRRITKSGQKKFLLQDVLLASCFGRQEAVLSRECKSNGLLFSKKAGEVFV